ncbi:MAG TPA: lysophospholipid acyltransferase family protein [Acetobacteraceae bacterium]|nr:lysophospholipid acyltransferase family protein [Acetobacteraceae bacterium]
MTLLRSALFNAWFFGLTFVMGVIGIAVRLIAPQRVIDYAMLWARLVLGGLYRICGIRLVVIGAEHLPRDGAALIASQHRSAFDTLVWLTLVPRASYVLKRELQRIPLFGPLLRPGGQIAIDRGAGAAALRSLLRGAERAASEHRQIVIFPEGTRVAAGANVALHPGVVAAAARLHLPVIPVATDSGRRWSRRAFRKHRGPIHLVVRPPLPAGLGRDELMRRLRQEWQAGEAAFGPVDKSVG